METESPEFECNCKVSDPFLCWVVRYGVQLWEVKDDGGPCLCQCHTPKYNDEEGEIECDQ